MEGCESPRVSNLWGKPHVATPMVLYREKKGTLTGPKPEAPVLHKKALGAHLVEDDKGRLQRRKLDEHIDRLAEGRARLRWDAAGGISKLLQRTKQETTHHLTSALRCEMHA